MGIMSSVTWTFCNVRGDGTRSRGVGAHLDSCCICAHTLKVVEKAAREDVALFDCEKWFMFLVTFVHR